MAMKGIVDPPPEIPPAFPKTVMTKIAKVPSQYIQLIGKTKSVNSMLSYVDVLGALYN